MVIDFFLSIISWEERKVSFKRKTKKSFPNGSEFAMNFIVYARNRAADRKENEKLLISVVSREGNDKRTEDSLLNLG